MWFFVTYSQSQVPDHGTFPVSEEFQDSSINPSAPDRLLVISPISVDIDHSWKDDACPHMYAISIDLTGPYLGTWQLDKKSIPAWLELPRTEGNLPDRIDQLQFNCNLVNFTDHVETARLNFQSFNQKGEGTSQGSVDISLKITSQ